MANISGTYETNYGNFHIRQEGNSLTGCYEHDEGVLTGGIDGSILKFEWKQTATKGPAVMVITPDGKQLFGLWWDDGRKSASGVWNGKRISDAIGTCPHWSGGAENQLKSDLEKAGRARVYGINFDSDSDHIRDDSKPTLDQIVDVLKQNAAWKMTIEGHTDSTASAEHNQQLSQARALSVKNYLVAAGIDASRLSPAGLGATKPVADNGSPLGRAQNRRVELVKQ
jgi:outer membrane protein OmpA-like peptidoglycan-associated protein